MIQISYQFNLGRNKQEIGINKGFVLTYGQKYHKDINVILSSHMYLLARNILSSRSCSLCSYVCIGLPRPAHPPKVKYSLSAHMNKGKANRVQAIRQNISLLEGVLVLEGKCIHMSRENKTLETEYFWPIDTCKQREREGGVHTI